MPKNKLKDLQSQMSKSIFRGHAKLDIFDGTGPTPLKEGFETYQRNYLYGILGVFDECFPATKSALSEQNFKYYMRAFLLENPPKNPNIENAVRGFHEFLRGKEELWLSELCRFEFYLYTKLGTCQHPETKKIVQGNIESFKYDMLLIRNAVSKDLEIEELAEGNFQYLFLEEKNRNSASQILN